MIFDKINFTLNILSSNTILASKQNLLKLYVADTISDTNIETVEYRIVAPDGRNTSNVIVNWTEMTQNDTFYTHEFTPTFTTPLNLQLSVKVTDYAGNNYILTENLKGVI